MDPIAAFGPYSVLRAISANADSVSFACAYAAGGDTRHIVSLKVLRPHVTADVAFSDRLRNEIVLAARLNHVNVAQVFDLGVAHGLHYVALEFVDGIPLAALQAAVPAGQRAVTTEVTAFVCAEVCAGLAYAQGRRDERGRDLGIVHTRVGPRTVLLAKAGLIKVIDFGLARAETEARLASADDADLRAMAPEVVRGEPYDVRADVFSVGALAYLLLSGRPLYEGVSGADLRARAARGYVPNLRDVDSTVPADLAEIVMGALAADPSQRTTDPSELRSGFAAWLRRNAPGFGRHRLKSYMQRLMPDSTYDLLPGQAWEPLHRKHFRNIDSDSVLADSVEYDPAISPQKDDVHALLEAPSLPRLAPIDIAKMTTGAHVTARESAIRPVTQGRMPAVSVPRVQAPPPVAAGQAPEDGVFASRPYDLDDGSTDLPEYRDEDTEKPAAAAPAQPSPQRLAPTDRVDPNAIYDDSVQLDPDEAEQAPRGRGWIGLTLGVLVLAALGGGAYRFIQVRTAAVSAGAPEASTVFLTSRPQGAEIVVDGTPSGVTTPSVLRDPQSGSTVTVTLDGFETPPAQTLDPAVAREMTFELLPAEHRIWVDSDPSGAEVVVDGDVVGTTPAQIGPLRVDYRQGIDLVLRLDGYLDEHVTVDWRPGEGESSVRRPLQPAPTPAGAP